MKNISLKNKKYININYLHLIKKSRSFINQLNRFVFYKNSAINFTTAMIIKFLFVIELELTLQFANYFALHDFSFIIRSECSAAIVLFNYKMKLSRTELALTLIHW